MASHSRFFWGLRLHLLCTLHGLPVGFALTGAKADERQALLGIFDADPELPAWRAGQIVITDKNYYGRQFEAELADADLDLLRPARKGEKPRPGTRFFKPLRQVSSRSTTRSRANSTSNSTAGTPPRRGLGTRRSARPGADRGDLAQRPQRSADQAIAGAYDH